MALCNRAVRLGMTSAICLTKLRAFDESKISNAASKMFISSSMNFGSSSSSGSDINRFEYKHISQLAKPIAKRAFLVDTLALVIISFLFYFSC